MRRCPKCFRTYDEGFLTCLDDGSPLSPEYESEETVTMDELNPEPPPEDSPQDAD